MTNKEYSAFVYDIVNEPESADLIEDIQLELIEASNAIFTKEKAGKQIKYKLSIPEENVTELTNEEVLLSLNLLMDYAVLTYSERQKYDLKRDPKTGMPIYTVKLVSTGPVKLSDTLQSMEWLVTYPSILDGSIQEKINERALSNMLADIKSMNVSSQSYSNDERLVNLKNSLLSYKGSMESTGTHDRFKQLFNALELALKYDGSDEKGEQFDKEISGISGIDKEQIELWRKLYNKLKHGTQGTDDVIFVAKGVSNFYKDLPFLRHTTNVVIQKRMRQILHNEE